MDNLYNKCAFTGHREFCGQTNIKKLESAVLSLAENGIDTFYCGMAAGFDLACAECVLELKNRFDLKLIACIPCPEQDKFFSPSLKQRYKKALEGCDERIVLSSSYFNGCMQMRDRYMVDNCDIVLCYLTKDTGGTFYTVNYAEKKGKKIIKLNID